MTDSTTATRLRNVVAEHLGFTDDPGKIAPESSFREDLGADSIDIVEVAMAIEDELHIQITDDEVHASMGEGTFGKLCELVEGKLARATA